MIVNAAVEEDVSVIGISVLSGAHNAVVPEIIDKAKAAGMGDVLYILGGIVADEDFDDMYKAGVHKIYTPGASLEEIVEYIKENAPVRG